MTPAITRNAYGAGTSYYVGTRLEGAGMGWLLERVCREAGVGAPLAAPFGVEVVQRRDDSHSYTFVLNHNLEDVTIELPGAVHDLISGEDYRSRITLGPRGVAILQA